MSETVTGYIDHVIFRNEDNGYTVMVLKGGSEEDELTCVGSFPVVTQGASVELEGNFTQHPVYGKQFQAVRLTEKMPEDALAVERYLGSGAIKGIGAALAARIVRRFGDDTMRIVEEEPERLAEIKGISEKKAMEIAAESGREIEIEDAIKYPSVLLYGEIDAAEYLANRNLSDAPPKPESFLGKGIRFTMGIDWEHIDRNKIYIIYYTDAEKFDGFALLPCRDWYVAY